MAACNPALRPSGLAHELTRSPAAVRGAEGGGAGGKSCRRGPFRQGPMLQVLERAWRCIGTRPGASAAAQSNAATLSSGSVSVGGVSSNDAIPYPFGASQEQEVMGSAACFHIPSRPRALLTGAEIKCLVPPNLPLSLQGPPRLFWADRSVIRGGPGRGGIID